MADGKDCRGFGVQATWLSAGNPGETNWTSAQRCSPSLHEAQRGASRRMGSAPEGVCLEAASRRRHWTAIPATTTPTRLIASAIRRAGPLFSHADISRPTTKSQKLPLPRQPRQPLDFFRGTSRAPAQDRAPRSSHHVAIPPRHPQAGCCPEAATSRRHLPVARPADLAAPPHRHPARGRLRAPCPPDPATRPATSSSG